MFRLLLVLLALASPSYEQHQCRRGHIKGESVSLKNVRCAPDQNACEKFFYDQEIKGGPRHVIAYFDCATDANCPQLGECEDRTEAERPQNEDRVIHTAVKCCDPVFIK